MKILWACPVFLHPTTKGGQIRTLETLRQLHRWHEIHFVALDSADNREGIERASEYCSHVYPVKHRAPAKTSPVFFMQFARGAFSPIPLAVSRFASATMRALIEDLEHRVGFDHVVCDFLATAPNIPSIERAVLFQHNVETTIWERRESTATNPLHQIVYTVQRQRMFAYERDICQRARRVIAVSEEDAKRMRSLFGVARVSDVPTGVDIEHFTPTANARTNCDLVFVGSMDWMPNVDGMLYFISEVLPLVRREIPDCSVAIVGRTPGREILEAAARDPLITVTGTVPDTRPYLWGSAVSIVPLRIGGGTRLKIYEAMAAKTPVVSTTIGAEGLPLESGRHIHLADDPHTFAARCVELLRDPDARQRMADEAWSLVKANFSWEQAARRFEQALRKSIAPAV
jgi:glycosyltransferase involved in cell wall biosynthesis